MSDNQKAKELKSKDQKEKIGVRRRIIEIKINKRKQG